MVSDRNCNRKCIVQMGLTLIPEKHAETKSGYLFLTKTLM